MTNRFPVIIAASALCGLSCGDSESSNPQALLSVGGTYQTAVTLTSSTCQNTTVQTFPTTVTHTPGASALSLTHAGSTYTGTVDLNGAFRTPAAPSTINGTIYTIAITGQFTVTAMDASVTVQVGQVPPCQFVARWQGPKTGAPNVIP